MTPVHIEAVYHRKKIMTDACFDPPPFEKDEFNDENNDKRNNEAKTRAKSVRLSAKIGALLPTERIQSIVKDLLGKEKLSKIAAVLIAGQLEFLAIHLLEKVDLLHEKNERSLGKCISIDDIKFVVENDALYSHFTNIPLNTGMSGVHHLPLTRMETERLKKAMSSSSTSKKNASSDNEKKPTKKRLEDRETIGKTKKRKRIASQYGIDDNVLKSSIKKQKR